MGHKFAICLCIKLSIVQGGPAVENGDLFSLINRNQLLLWRDQPFILCWGTLPGKCRLGLAISLNGRPMTLSVESIILYLIGDKWLCLANGKKRTTVFFFFCSFITLWILSHKTEQETSYWPVARILSKNICFKVAFPIGYSLFQFVPIKTESLQEYLYFTINVFYIWYLKNIKSRKRSPQNKVRNKL